MTQSFSPPTVDDVKSTLRGVIDPELNDNIVDLGMVESVVVKSDKVTLKIALTVAGCPLRTQLKTDISAKVGSLPGVTAVEIEMGVMDANQRAALMARARWKARENAPSTTIPADTRIIAISSGKGGVGKSSVTVNLAVALAHRGLAVGVLDADIAGFSIPRLLGVDERLNAINGKIHPIEKPFGSGLLKVVSMGLIEGSGEDEAIMLRGLMLNRALQHFLEDVEWGGLDYLIIDMPPGTSDVQMGLARMMPRTDMLVVTTPSLAAQNVAARSIDMARRGHLRVAGIIENMSAFICEHGDSFALFGEGGGQRLSESTGVPLLASIPLNAELSTGGDLGKPIVESNPSSSPSIAFKDLAHQIATDVIPLVEMSGCTSRLLDAAAKIFEEKRHA